MFSGHGGPGHEFADAVCRMTVGQPGQCSGQPGVRVDAGKFAVFDERADHRTVVAALVETGEQGVLAVQRKGSDRELDGVAVEVDAAIGEESRETIPAGQRVADRFAKLAFSAYLAVVGFEILAKVIDYGVAALSANLSSLLHECATYLVLDGVKLGDTVQHLGSDR